MRTFHELEQNSEDWFRARAGLVTASEFETAIAEKGPMGGEPKGRRTYLLKLLGERLTGEPQELWAGNAHTERGKALEPEARDLYSMLTGQELRPGGFWTIDIDVGQVGASPDSLVGDKGLLEVKTKLPHLHLDVLLKGEVPAEHLVQIHGQIIVTGAAWCDFMSYWPGLPPFIKRVTLDDAQAARILAGLVGFNRELAELEARFTDGRARSAA